MVEEKDKIYLTGGFATDTFGGPLHNTVQFVDFTGVDTLKDAKARKWIFMENLKNPVASHSVIYRNEQLPIVGSSLFGSSKPSYVRTCQDVQFVNLEENTTGVYADTLDCGKYSKFPGMYSTIGSNVSVFGGSGAKEKCIQQIVSGNNLGSTWNCLSRSESVLEGWWSDQRIRFSNGQLAHICGKL